MADLDVSDLLLDPTLADAFNFKRRPVTVGDNGRQTIGEQAMKGIGVFTAAHPNDLERLPEMERMGRHICIVTKTRLQGPAPNFQPDLVTWMGDDFIVKLVDPYPQYGAGFVQVIAGSVDAIDQPVP